MVGGAQVKRPQIIVGVRTWVMVSTAVIALGLWAGAPLRAWLGAPVVVVAPPPPAPHVCKDEAVNMAVYTHAACDPDQAMEFVGSWLTCRCRR